MKKTLVLLLTFLSTSSQLLAVYDSAEEQNLLYNRYKAKKMTLEQLCTTLAAAPKMRFRFERKEEEQEFLAQVRRSDFDSKLKGDFANFIGRRNKTTKISKEAEDFVKEFATDFNICIKHNYIDARLTPRDFTEKLLSTSKSVGTPFHIRLQALDKYFKLCGKPTSECLRIIQDINLPNILTEREQEYLTWRNPDRNPLFDSIRDIYEQQKAQLIPNTGVSQFTLLSSIKRKSVDLLTGFERLVKAKKLKCSFTNPHFFEFAYQAMISPNTPQKLKDDIKGLIERSTLCRSWSTKLDQHLITSSWIPAYVRIQSYMYNYDDSSEDDLLVNDPKIIKELALECKTEEDILFLLQVLQYKRGPQLIEHLCHDKKTRSVLIEAVKLYEEIIDNDYNINIAFREPSKFLKTASIAIASQIDRDKEKVAQAEAAVPKIAPQAKEPQKPTPQQTAAKEPMKAPPVASKVTHVQPAARAGQQPAPQATAKPKAKPKGKAGKEPVKATQGRLTSTKEKAKASVQATAPKAKPASAPVKTPPSNAPNRAAKGK